VVQYFHRNKLRLWYFPAVPFSDIYKDSMTYTCNKTAGSHGRYPGFSVEEIHTRPLHPVAPSHHEIAVLAYFYWEASGRRSGRDWEHWFRAERELRAGRTVYAR